MIYLPYHLRSQFDSDGRAAEVNWRSMYLAALRRHKLYSNLRNWSLWLASVHIDEHLKHNQMKLLHVRIVHLLTEAEHRPDKDETTENEQNFNGFYK
jgi:hypothetical protein